MGGIENLSLGDEGAFGLADYSGSEQGIEDFAIAGDDGISGIKVASADELEMDEDVDFDDDWLS